MDSGRLFSTPFAVSSQDQNAIIDYTLTHGSIIPAESNLIEPFWVGLGLTRILDANVPPMSDYMRGRWYYYMRLNSRVGWQWENNPATEVVRRLLQPLEPYFKCFTRATVILQIPNVALPAHRDLVPFNEYENMFSPHSTLPGDKKLTYVGEGWLAPEPNYKSDVSHASQGYLNLKIPISANPHSPGAPYINDRGEKYYYNSQNKILFINEVEIEHGGDPVDYYRGVVFVDGIFNPETFPLLPRECVQVAQAPSWV
jgi:hypothetical protein